MTMARIPRRSTEARAGALWKGVTVQRNVQDKGSRPITRPARYPCLSVAGIDHRPNVEGHLQVTE
jgi:hypothetical protein